MKARTAGIIGVIVGVLILMLGFGGTPTSATKGEDHKQSVCHPVEGRGETGNGWNIISPDKASSHINEETGEGKHTRKDGRTDVYAVDGKCPGPEIPEWTEPTYPELSFGECMEYRLEKFVSTWDADTGTWSEWTDWAGAGPLDWGVIPANLTGHHGGSHKKDGDRHFAYVAIDKRAVTTGECAPPPPCEWNPQLPADSEECVEPTTTAPEVTTTTAPEVTTTTEAPVITTTVPPTTPPTVATTTPPTVPPPSLPETGSNATIWTAIIGLLALAGGSGLIYASRRS